MVDIFHGENHPVAQSIRACVNRLGPGLPRIITQYASTRLEGMNFVHRIMYELQQDYFGYLDRVILPQSRIALTLNAKLLLLPLLLNY